MLHCASRHRTTFACAPAFALVWVVESLALTLGSVPSAAPVAAEPAVSELPPVVAVAVVPVVPVAGALSVADVPFTLAPAVVFVAVFVAVADVDEVPVPVVVTFVDVVPVAVVPVVPVTVEVVPVVVPVTVEVVPVTVPVALTPMLGAGVAVVVRFTVPGSANATNGIIAESAAATRTLMTARIRASIFNAPLVSVA